MTSSGLTHHHFTAKAVPPQLPRPVSVRLGRGTILIATASVMVSVLTSGCSYRRSTSYISQLSVYSRVTTSDFEGRCLAQYIAEGPVEETRGGFTFRALERRIYQPSPLVFRYPLGRPVVAIASNIVVEPAPRPTWLPPNLPAK